MDACDCGGFFVLSMKLGEVHRNIQKMVYSNIRNRNGDQEDGFFGRDTREVTLLVLPDCLHKRFGNIWVKGVKLFF